MGVKQVVVLKWIMIFFNFRIKNMKVQLITPRMQLMKTRRNNHNYLKVINKFKIVNFNAPYLKLRQPL